MISFVYFDLGGVVIKDFSKSNKWEALIEELGIDVAYQDVFADFWRDGERENCTTRDVETLLPIIKEKFDAHIPEHYSLLQGFVKRFEDNKSLWPILEKVQQTTKIGLLTNQYPHMLDAIKKRNIMPSIQWDVVIDSSVVGFIKPDKEIFALAQEKAGVPNNEILLIDNSRWNTDGAEKFGWQTFLYDPGDYEDASKDLAIFWQHLSESSSSEQ